MRRHKRRWRKVHIKDAEWKYCVLGHTIEIRDPEHGKLLLAYSTLFPGWTPDLLERAHWKGNRIDAVTPGVIKEYLTQTYLA